ncbi:IRF3 factor, partial [Geococcyx californianus]|nr:IRF3 factor [Geococcyx californianus]
ARREGPRLRFAPWLLNAVSSGSYRGLRWTDPTRTAFRVPWKHNARKDLTGSDLEVFRVGGMRVQGGWDGGGRRQQPGGRQGAWDPAKWKTNFRCALASTGVFKLLEDNSKCGDDPHKVF